MKKLLYFAIALLCFCNNYAAAQDKTPPQKRVEVSFLLSDKITTGNYKSGVSASFFLENTIPTTNFFMEFGASLGVTAFNEFAGYISLPLGVGYCISLNTSNVAAKIKEHIRFAPIVGIFPGYPYMGNKQSDDLYGGIMPQLGLSLEVNSHYIVSIIYGVAILGKNKAMTLKDSFSIGLGYAF